METIGQLYIIKELRQLNDNLTLRLAEGNDGQAFEVLTIIPCKDYQNLLDRFLRNEILPLIGQNRQSAELPISPYVTHPAYSTSI